MSATDGPAATPKPTCCRKTTRCAHSRTLSLSLSGLNTCKGKGPGCRAGGHKGSRHWGTICTRGRPSCSWAATLRRGQRTAVASPAALASRLSTWSTLRRLAATMVRTSSPLRGQGVALTALLAAVMVDWCRPYIDPKQARDAYAVFGSAIANSSNPNMLFGIWSAGIGKSWKWGADVGGHYWRTATDM